MFNECKKRLYGLEEIVISVLGDCKKAWGHTEPYKGRGKHWNNTVINQATQNCQEPPEAREK